MMKKAMYVLVYASAVVLAVMGGGFTAWPAENAPATFYVAPDGNDANRGTIDRPFRTIEKARDAARGLSKDAPKKIVLRGGSYYDVALALGPEDSGLTIEGALGERPVLYGGRPVTGWRKDGEFYAAPLSDVKDRKWDFHSIVVDDQWRPRARLPKTGAFKHYGRFPVRWLGTTGRGWERQPSEADLTTLKYNRRDLGPWLDVRNAEITSYNGWDETLVGLKSLNDTTQTVTFSIKASYPPGSFTHHEMIDGMKCYWQKGQTYVVWNVREGMKEPGQWYLDRTHEKLVYWPKPGEDISKLAIIAPTRETVIDIAEKAKNITLKGFTVSCTKTPMAEYAFGAMVFKGAVSGKGLDGCRFIDLRVVNVGGYGMRVYGNASRFENCEVANTGAGGVEFVGRNVVFTNNHIHDIGLTYPSGVAVIVSGNGASVDHNEVHATSYIAFLSGGEKNIIEHNLVYDVMRELNDGGCFFIVGTGNVIRENYCHGVPENEKQWAMHFLKGEDRFCWAYYMDEQATNCVFERNVAVNTVRPNHMHWTKNCFIRNNIFIDKDIQMLTWPRTSGLTFEKNILIADEVMISKPSDAMAALRNNIIYSPYGVATIEEIVIYTQIDVKPFDFTDGNILADPLFVDRDHNNFAFKPDSPALKMGIEPVDVSMAGRTGK